ncbi:MAG: serpin family protein [Eubacteriales bacterium]|nr:serpin family protein [Eubacteriales bacterium]
MTNNTTLKLVDFSMDLFKNCVKNDKNNNVLVSPFSLLYALGIAANGAVGETKSEMEKLWGVPTEELNQYLYEYAQSLPQDGDCTFKIANSLWVNPEDGLTLSQDFLEKNKSYYDALVVREPFNDGCKDKINGWVKEKTDGMIDKVVDSFSDADMLLLLNALAFNAKWEKSRMKIEEQIFTAWDGTAQNARMMFSSERDYLSDEHASGFLKFYNNSRFAFAALLPDESTNINDYLSELTGEKLRTILSTVQKAEVRVKLPIFTIEAQYSNLKETLKEMGMVKAFSGEADFSGLLTAVGEDTVVDENLNINEIQQKTFITVNEYGTKLSALVGACMSRSLRPEPKSVVLNRPFVYMIIDREKNLPISMGVLMKLKKD